tara:strand:+ start:17484 stop:17984 length:501 start_codon:yes stop_codon:yes gene_type:complete
MLVLVPSPRDVVNLETNQPTNHIHESPQVLGIIPLGTSLDYESERTRALGCWQAPDLLGKSIDEEFSSTTATPDFVPSKAYSNFLIDIGFGTDVAQDIRDYWVSEIEANYRGDDGRKRIRMAAINLRDRDGLHSRACDVVCPVLWLHVGFSFASTGRKCGVRCEDG